MRRALDPGAYRPCQQTGERPPGPCPGLSGFGRFVPVWAVCPFCPFCGNPGFCVGMDRPGPYGPNRTTKFFLPNRSANQNADRFIFWASLSIESTMEPFFCAIFSGLKVFQPTKERRIFPFNRSNTSVIRGLDRPSPVSRKLMGCIGSIECVPIFLLASGQRPYPNTFFGKVSSILGRLINC